MKQYMYVYDVGPSRMNRADSGERKVRIFIPIAPGEWASYYDWYIMRPRETQRSCFSHACLSLRELKKRARSYDLANEWSAKLLGKVPL